MNCQVCNHNEEHIMPELIKKETIIGRSPTGNAVLAFDNVTMAKEWSEKAPNHRIKFFRQVTTEEEVTL